MWNICAIRYRQNGMTWWKKRNPEQKHITSDSYLKNSYFQGKTHKNQLTHYLREWGWQWDQVGRDCETETFIVTRCMYKRRGTWVKWSTSTRWMIVNESAWALVDESDWASKCRPQNMNMSQRAMVWIHPRENQCEVEWVGIFNGWVIKRANLLWLKQNGLAL